MNEYLNQIKRLIPNSIKLYVNLLRVTSKDPRWLKYAKCNNKRIFVFLAGFYQNLGDMAITYAQVCFLKELYPDSTIICISSGDTYSSIKTIKQIVRNNDLITITGGGNMDDEYLSLEKARLFVINSFPDNRIVSFPQTVHYSNSLKGKIQCIISRIVYQKHQDLIVFAREKASFRRIKNYFPRVRAEICPDIVLSLNKREPIVERCGVLCCLRTDKERITNNADNNALVKTIKDIFEKVIVLDTVDVSIDQCIEEHYETTLEEYWNVVRKSQVVLTDRLHGMVFGIITGTPCVVIDNKNHKISEVYNSWLKDYSNIKLVEKVDHKAIIDSLLEMVKNSNKIENVQMDFNKLIQACMDKGNANRE